MTEEHRYVRHGEYGFLQAAASAVPAGFSLVVLPGLPFERLMFDLLTVDTAEGGGQHVIVSAHHPRLDEVLCERVRLVVSARWPQAQTSFITDWVYEPDGPTVRCVVYTGPHGQRVSAAAAVAESIRRSTLDDIETVSVTIDGLPHSVALKWAGTYARAIVVEGRRIAIR
jgi:hypothetical protein